MWSLNEILNMTEIQMFDDKFQKSVFDYVLFNRDTVYFRFISFVLILFCSSFFSSSNLLFGARGRYLLILVFSLRSYWESINAAVYVCLTKICLLEYIDFRVQYALFRPSIDLFLLSCDVSLLKRCICPRMSVRVGKNRTCYLYDC